MVLRDFNEKNQDPRLSILKVMHEVVFCLCSRMHAECSRMNAEASRMYAESFRMHAECFRMHAECFRMNAECFRMNAEASRMHAECSRMHARVCFSHNLTIVDRSRGALILEPGWVAGSAVAELAARLSLLCLCSPGSCG